MKKISLTAALLYAALALAIAMRFSGVLYGLPLDIAGDEFVHVATAFSFLNGMTLVASQAFSYSPSLMAIILAPFFALFGLIAMMFGYVDGLEGFKAFALFQSSWFIIGPRILSAVFGTFFLWIFYVLVRRFINVETAIIAVVLAAFDFWFVHESQLGHLWMPVVTLLMGTWYVALRIAEGAGRRWYVYGALNLVAGYWIGIIPILMAPWFLLAHWKRTKKNAGDLTIAVALFVIGIALVSYLNPVSFLRQFGRAMNSAFDVFGMSVFQTVAAQNEVSTDVIFNLLFLTKTAFLDNPLVFMIGALGLGLLMLKFGWSSFRSLLFVGFPVTYLVVAIFVWPHPDSRYMLPLLVPLIIGASYFLATCFDATSYAYPKTMRHLGIGLLFTMLSFSIFASVSYTRLIIGTDTRVLTYGWVLENIPDGTAVIVESNYLEFPRNASTTAIIGEVVPNLLRSKDRYLLEHVYRSPMPGYLALTQVDADVVSAEREDVVFEYFIRSFFVPRLAATVPMGFELMKTFYPRSTIVPIPDTLLDPTNPYGSFGRVHNLGPYVEVYTRVK